MDRTITGCSGMLAMACNFDSSSTWWEGEPVVDVAKGIFEFSVSDFCCAAFSITSSGFHYADDGYDSFEIGSIRYGMAYPLFHGRFDRVIVNGQEITPVVSTPLPAAGWLLLAGVGALAIGKRRNFAGATSHSPASGRRF